MAFATASRIQRCFTAELPFYEGRACQLDPVVTPVTLPWRRAARTKRCSSTSATQTTREHNHGSNRSPCFEHEAYPLRGSPGGSFTGDHRLAPCHVRHVAPGTSRPRVKERYDRQPRFHGPGAGRLSPQASLVHACALHRRHSRLSPVTDFRRDNVRELRPNPIRSGTSCHGLVAPLEGDSSGVYARPPRNAAP